MESMVRLIKRYGSRKLYDTKESCYVSIEKITSWIREGQKIRVIDKKTSQDLTSQILTHIISEEGKKGRSILSSDILHDLIRFGEKRVTDGVGHIQEKVDKVDKYVQNKVDKIKHSIGQLAPVKKMREEMMSLRKRLEELEKTMQFMDNSNVKNSSSEKESEMNILNEKQEIIEKDKNI